MSGSPLLTLTGLREHRRQCVILLIFTWQAINLHCQLTRQSGLDFVLAILHLNLQYQEIPCHWLTNTERQIPSSPNYIFLTTPHVWVATPQHVLSSAQRKKKKTFIQRPSDSQKGWALPPGRRDKHTHVKVFFKVCQYLLC